MISFKTEFIIIIIFVSRIVVLYASMAIPLREERNTYIFHFHFKNFLYKASFKTNLKYW